MLFRQGCTQPSGSMPWPFSCSVTRSHPPSHSPTSMAIPTTQRGSHQPSDGKSSPPAMQQAPWDDVMGYGNPTCMVSYQMLWQALRGKINTKIPFGLTLTSSRAGYYPSPGSSPGTAEPQPPGEGFVLALNTQQGQPSVPRWAEHHRTDSPGMQSHPHSFP